MQKYKTLIIIGAVVLFIILIYGLFAGTYNSLVEKEAVVENKWADVETQYQRRTDLIPGLVAVVKGYANHEQQTLIGVIMQRASSIQTKINADELNAENIEKFQEAQQELSQGIGRLLAIGENYPDLKASANFTNLQDELAGTENRIAKIRTEYNEVVKAYNVYIKKFPRNMLADMYDFEEKDYFKADEGSEKAPTIEF